MLRNHVIDVKQFCNSRGGKKFRSRAELRGWRPASATLIIPEGDADNTGPLEVGDVAGDNLQTSLHGQASRTFVDEDES